MKLRDSIRRDTIGNGRSRAKAAAAAITASLLVTTLASCSSNHEEAGRAPGDLGELTIQLSWIKNVEFAGEYFADAKGYYRDAGFSSVNLLAGGGQVGGTDAVSSGQALVGISQPAAVAAAAAQGAPLKIIGATFQKNAFCLLSLQEKTPIRTVSELKGKRIGVQNGSNGIVLDGFLKANGISTSDVTAIPTQYDISPLIKGDYDAHMSFVNNEPVLAKADGYTPVCLDFANNGLPMSAEVFVATDDSIKNKSAQLEAFLAAQIRGWTDAVKDPQQSAEYAVTKYGADQDLQLGEQVEEMNAQLPLILTDDVNAHGLFTQSDAVISASVASLKAMGIEASPQLWDMSLLKKVYAEHPDLKTTFTIPKS